jgi:hypothetical protein
LEDPPKKALLLGRPPEKKLYDPHNPQKQKTRLLGGFGLFLSGEVGDLLQP